MNEKVFKISVLLLAILFSLFFLWVVVPPFLENPDILGAFGAGFVNPYATGYSTDVVFCWLVLCVWIIYEYPKVKYGWTCLLIGIVPGVAVGFAAYLLLRANQLKIETKD